MSGILEAAGYLSKEAMFIHLSVHVLSLSQAVASAPVAVSLNITPGSQRLPFGHSLIAQPASPGPVPVHASYLHSRNALFPSFLIQMSQL